MIVGRWSARKWIVRIMVSWGVITILTGFVRTAGQFYFARFLLSAAESSFFPGMAGWRWLFFCRAIFLLGFIAAVLPFFIAGLLIQFICALSTSINWERTASRPEVGLLIPSDFATDRPRPKGVIYFGLGPSRRSREFLIDE